MANISNSSANTVVNGTSSADSIKNSPNTASNVQIYAGDGNDTILNEGAQRVTIDSGNGNDTIKNTYYNSTSYSYYPHYASINAGAGDDSIYNNNGNYAMINAGDGNDSVYNSYGYYATINAGDGDDFIHNYSYYSTINAGAGDDTIRAYNNYQNTIIGGAGNDSISLVGGRTTIGGGALIQYASSDGDDTITNFAESDTIQITDGTISNFSESGNDVIINVGSGSITLKNAKNIPIHTKLANGTKQNYYSSYFNSWIMNQTDNTLVSGTTNSDKIYNDGSSRVTVNASSSNDSIYNYNGYYSLINAGDGNDTVYNYYGHYATIMAGSGDDSIYNYYGHHATINTGDGNDTVYNYSGDTSTIDLGDGNDSYYAYDNDFVSINAGAGNDTVTGDIWRSTLDAGAGDDYIGIRVVFNNLINAGAGNDTVKITSALYNSNGVYNPEYLNTLEGGTGDDSIELYKNGSNGGYSVVKYASGDGNDTITNWTKYATLSLADDDYYTTLQSGNDIVVNVGNGSILLKDAAGQAVNITGGTKDGGEYIVASDSYTTLYTGPGNDTLLSDGYKYLTIDSGKGKDIINLKNGLEDQVGTFHEILYSVGDGNKTIEGWDETNIIHLTNATNFSAKVNSTGDVEIYGIGGSSNTGSILIKGAQGKMVSIKDKDGKFNNTFYRGINDTVKAIANSDIHNYTDSNDPEWYYQSTIKATEQNDYIHVDTVYDDTIVAGKGNDTIRDYGNSNVLIAGEGNDYVQTYSTRATINFGRGNDTINISQSFNDEHYHLIQFSAGQGNNVLLGYTENDTIQITGGASQRETTRGSDRIISIGDASLTLVDAADINPIIVNVAYPGLDESSGIIENYTPNSLVSGSDNADTIYNYSEGRYSTVQAKDGNDVITNEANYTTIYGGAGADSVYVASGHKQILIFADDGNDTINNMAGVSPYTTMYGGNGNDSIYSYWRSYADGGNGEDTLKVLSGSITGGAGNDYIDFAFGNRTYNVGITTISGGQGNDTIHTETRDPDGFARVYTYKSGDGVDIIDGFGVRDTLQILDDSYYNTLVSGNDIVVSLSNGSITLKNTAAFIPNIQGGIFDAVNTISNYDDYTVVSGLAGRDSIYNMGEEVTINSGKGNDTIYSYSGFYAWNKFLYADGDGDDIIQSFGMNDTIQITQGTVSNVSGSGNDLILKVGTGSITLKNAKDKVCLVADSSNSVSAYLWNGSSLKNVIYNDTKNSTVNGTSNADYIYTGHYSHTSYPTTVIAGAGNDTIFNDSRRSSINAGDGNDTIYNYDWYNTIVGGKGNDTITNYFNNGNVIQFANGDGKDIITTYRSNDTLQITDGSNYSTVMSGDDLVVTLTSGSVTIKNIKNTDVFNIVDGSFVPIHQITLPAGLSYNENHSAITANDIYADPTLDSATLDSIVETIDGSVRSKAIYIIGNDNNNVIIGGKGNDTFTGGDGYDKFVYTTGKDVITDYNANEDSIIVNAPITKAVLKNNDMVLTVGTNKNNEVTIKNGKSKIVSVTDSSTDYKYTLIDDGKNVYNRVTSVDSVVSGSLLNDDIYAHGISSTINPGKGNDTIQVYSHYGEVIQYANGDGKDLINNTSSSWNSIIDLQKGTSIKSVKLKGDDQILNIGSGAITLKGIGTDAAVEVRTTKGNGYAYTRYLKAKGYNDLNKGLGSYIYAENSVIAGTKNNDYIGLSGLNNTINTAAGNDLIYNAVQDSNVNSGAGNDSIVNDEAYNGYIVAGEGNDSIVNENAGNLTIKGGKGNDTISFNTEKKTAGNVLQYADNDGKDIVFGFETIDTIQLMTEDAVIKKSTVKKNTNDVILTIGKTNVTLKDMKNKAITVIDYDGNVSKAVYDNGLVVIEGTENDDKLMGTTTKDSINGLAGNDTLQGNAGNDTLTGGDGKDYFVYSEGDGKDVITDYTEGDVIKITEGEISKIITTKKTNDVTFKVGKGTITLKDAKGKKISFIDEEDNFTTQVYGATMMSVFDSDIDVIDITQNTDMLKVDASERTLGVHLIGNDKANTLISGKGDDTLTGNKGADYFVYNGGNDIITDYTLGQDKVKFNESVQGVYTEGDDLIVQLVGEGTVTIQGAGNKSVNAIDYQDLPIVLDASTTVTVTNASPDTVKASVGKYVIDATKRTKNVMLIGNENDNTIISGKKDDTLTGGEGADVFLFTSGNGNDVITDYYASETDVIQLGKGTYINDVSIDGNDYVFTIGNKGKITVQNATEQYAIYFKDENNNTINFYPQGNSFSNVLPSGELEDILPIKNNEYTTDYKYFDEKDLTQELKVIATSKDNDK